MNLIEKIRAKARCAVKRIGGANCFAVPLIDLCFNGD